MIVQGFLRILNFFDIAEAIGMETLRGILGPEAAPRSAAFAHRSPEYAQAQHAPIVEFTGPLTLPSGEKFETQIKYFWFGVAAVELAVEFKCDFDALSGLSHRWMNAPEVEQAAESLVRARLDRFRPVLIRPSAKWLDEEYLIIDIESAQQDIESAQQADGRPVSGAEMLQCCAGQITQIVRGEITPLSAGEREEIVRSALSYYPSDLIVVGWAAALVYDKPDATPAVNDLLEYANTQLLEFRYYDELLSSLLSNVYSSLEGQESLFSSWRLSRRAVRLNRIRLDIMDLAERTEYAVKFISDSYYARVYGVSSAKIGVNDYKMLVDEKLKTAGELYEFMVAQFNERRMFAIEVVVAILVLLDVILLLRH